MLSEPFNTLVDLALGLLIIWGFFVVMVLTAVLVLSLWFWAQEKLERRVPFSDRRIARYGAEQLAVIEALYAIPHDGEWLRWEDAES
jgi:hypothetical protein